MMTKQNSHYTQQWATKESESLFYLTCSLNVSITCKSINCNLYSIRKIRKYLDTPTAEKMINCYITHAWIIAIVSFMVQKVTIYPSYSSARTVPPGFCPCAANSIISLQFWKTYTGCLLSKESNTRCCSSLIKLWILYCMSILFVTLFNVFYL